MPPKTHSSAFSDASTQAAALKEWRQRNAQHKETASTLQRKVRQLKRDSEAVQKANQWLQERDSLNREQEICETNLGLAGDNLGELVYDSDHEERQAELTTLKTLLLQQLRDAGALTHGPRLNSTRNEEADIRLREWIELEMSKAGADAASLSATVSHGACSALSADLDTAACEAKDAFALLCSTYQPSAELQHIFSSALTSSEAEVQAQLEGLQMSDPTAAESDVLRTVCLIIKMGHQARQFNLSAASRAALAERVAAVYPNMAAAQVQSVIDEGLSLRRAQAAARAAVADYRRNVAVLLSACESAYVVARRAEEERAERAEAARLRGLEQATRHARLAERRASHEALLHRRHSAEKERQSAAAAKADALRAKQAAEFQERLGLLQAYEAQRALLREKEQALLETKARAAEEEKAARMRRNETRVEYRRQQEERRRREQKEQEREVRALQLEKQQALERFFASVDKQLGVEADPLRILKATTSSAQTESYETLAQTTRPSIAGFSDEQIMKDPRVRLYHALLAAGLHTTSYGREVVTRGYHVAPSQLSSENNPLRGQFS